METNNVDISNLMINIHTGKIQLPDFQRNWVWDKEQIRYLLASVLSDYPIGALMFWACGDNIPFKYRPIEGAPLKIESPESLILDGQQRLTAIYCAMFSENPVKTKNGKGSISEYNYFFDIEKFIDETDDILNSVKAVQIKKGTTDLKLQAKQIEKKLFPLNIILNDTKKNAWFDAYRDHHRKDSIAIEIGMKFRDGIAAKIKNYSIPVIRLEKATSLEAVCRMFENINKKNEPLTVFDLLTAKFAKQNTNLRDEWKKIADSKNFSKVDGVLSAVKAVDFLTACTLYNSYIKNISETSSIGCKRTDILGLSISDYKARCDKLKIGFIDAKIFLSEEKIFRSKDLPYTTQLIPLAVLWAIIKKSPLDNATTKKKIRQWFWCGVFGEAYGSSANSTRYANDIVSVMRWINGGEEPKMVKEMEFISTRLLTRQGAIHKGIIALILQNNCKDFIKGDNMAIAFPNDKNIEIHHIFPKKYCTQKNFDKTKWDCALNKTPLRDDTNREIGGNDPSKYIKTILKRIDEKTLAEILKSNWIEIDDLRKDDFRNFILHRAKYILKAIEEACGKTFEISDEVLSDKLFGVKI